MPVVPTPTTIARPPDWTAFTRFVADLDRWLAPPEPVPARAVPAPHSLPPRAPTSTGWNCPTLAGAFVAIFGVDAHWADRITHRESRCQPGARNPAPCSRRGDHAFGLMQLCLPMHEWAYGVAGCLTSSVDPWCQLRAAHALYVVNGRAPWAL